MDFDSISIGMKYTANSSIDNSIRLSISNNYTAKPQAAIRVRIALDTKQISSRHRDANKPHIAAVHTRQIRYEDIHQLAR